MNEYTALVEADAAVTFEAEDESDARRKMENTHTGQLGPPTVIGLEGPDVETESNQIASLAVTEVNIYDVKGGYEIGIDLKDSDETLYAFQSPKDPLWEQLVELGIIEVEL